MTVNWRMAKTGRRTFTACSMVSPEMDTMLFNWSGDVDRTNFSCFTWTSLSHDGKRRTHSYNESLTTITWRMWWTAHYLRWVWYSAGAIWSAPLHLAPIRILFARTKKSYNNIFPVVYNFFLLRRQVEQWTNTYQTLVFQFVTFCHCCWRRAVLCAPVLSRWLLSTAISCHYNSPRTSVVDACSPLQ